MRNQKATFQDYNMNQLYLPMDYSDLIPENHIVHVVNDMVNGLSDDIFFEAYRGGGRPAYHPKMMTKIILFGYTQKWFSCRDIAKALTENLPMMWLAAGQSPDFRTINRFRSERLQPLMDRLFTELTKLLIEEEYVDGKQYFLDGTKMEANGNKYSFVWKKSIQGYEQAKIEALLEEIHHHIKLDQENLQKEDSLFGTQRISSESLQRVINSIEEELHEREAKVKQAQNPDEKKEMKKAFRAWKKIHIQASTDYLPRLQKYEEAFRTFGVRNSYSKVDVDATFMRMKDDHMNNGQLKAGYNWQIGTQNQFILHYSLHTNPTDTRCLKPHIASLKQSGSPLSEVLIADAGYGSESNYVAMEEENFDTLIPYNTFRQEQKRSYSKKAYHPHNRHYDEADDFYWCPNERKVLFKRYSQKTDRYGYKRDFKIYESESCEGCPFKSDCTKAKGNRQIHYNPVYEELRAKQNRKLNSEEGRTLYQKRKIDVESVFGHIKQNLGFRRLHLRGRQKVHVELGLIALAHNFKKRVAVDRHSKDIYSSKIRKNHETFHHVSWFFFKKGLLRQPLCS